MSGMVTFREQADKIGKAKSHAMEVLETWPDELDGLLDLEDAIEKLGRCETELDNAADNPDAHL